MVLAPDRVDMRAPGNVNSSAPRANSLCNEALVSVRKMPPGDIQYRADERTSRLKELHAKRVNDVGTVESEKAFDGYGSLAVQPLCCARQPYSLVRV